MCGMKAKLKQCSIEGCDKPVRARELCNKHLTRMYHGISDMRPGNLPRKGQGKGRKLPPWKPNDPRYKNRGRLCDVPECVGLFYAKGLCRSHYHRTKRKGFLADRLPIIPHKCIIDGCHNETKAGHGLCKTHYDRKRKGTDLNRPIGVKGELNYNWKGGVAEYPDHSKLKKVRKQVLKEENYTCFVCGSHTNQVHHLDGTKSNHDRSNLHACCHSCNIKFAGKHQSKYTRAYGKTQKELSRELGLSMNLITFMHKTGILRNRFIPDEIKAVLF